MSDALSNALQSAILKIGELENFLSEALNRHLIDDRRQRAVDVPGFGVAIVGPGKHIRAATGPETEAYKQSESGKLHAALQSIREAQLRRYGGDDE